ncbi:hypothetical protein AGLY_012780 [Aphis glycines]|uniref:Uncharacterized protein n=1 Tax=Aphis glycines TaxID=307491 RepID=A0A6G0T8Z9_APHGL|nr:hypothetical protein AGLY_012780 [Aphis glycines]
MNVRDSPDTRRSADVLLDPRAREALTLVRPGYRESAHAVPVLRLITVRVFQHLAVTRPHDFVDGFALHYALESGSLATNYSYNKSFTCYCLKMFSARVRIKHLGCRSPNGFGKLVYHWYVDTISRVSRVTVSRIHGIHYTELVSEIVFEIRNSGLGQIGLPLRLGVPLQRPLTPAVGRQEVRSPLHAFVAFGLDEAHRSVHVWRRCETHLGWRPWFQFERFHRHRRRLHRLQMSRHLDISDGSLETRSDRLVHRFLRFRVVRTPYRLYPALIVALVIALSEFASDELRGAPDLSPTVLIVLVRPLHRMRPVWLTTALKPRIPLGAKRLIISYHFALKAPGLVRVSRITTFPDRTLHNHRKEYIFDSKLLKLSETFCSTLYFDNSASLSKSLSLARDLILL